MIYLDANATTRPCHAAIDAAARALSDTWHNPSSIHRPGQAARRTIDLARASLAALIGARPAEIILTSGGTESIDLAIRGVLAASPQKRALVTSRVEHSAVRDLADHLARAGAQVRWAPLAAGGVIDTERLAPLIDSSVALVSIQAANNETGAIQPVRDIARLCRAVGVPFHCDAVQWAGKLPLDVTDLGVDLLTISPHKFHGPKGAGLLWVRPGVRVRPVLQGAQELGRRGGTENVPGIAGAGAAADRARAWLSDPAPRDALAALRDEFESIITHECPQAVINRPPDPALRLWNTSSIAFPGLAAEALLVALSERGVCASAGAACSSGSLEPSPVLLAMGVPEPQAHGSLRFSLSRDTTRDEIRDAAAIIAQCVRRMG